MKFKGKQCRGLTEQSGWRVQCRVFSGSTYKEAAPLRRGSPWCHFHRKRCAGKTLAGRRCCVTSSSQNTHAAPLREGKRFCAHHSDQSVTCRHCIWLADHLPSLQRILSQVLLATLDSFFKSITSELRVESTERLGRPRAGEGPKKCGGTSAPSAICLSTFAGLTQQRCLRQRHGAHRAPARAARNGCAASKTRLTTCEAQTAMASSHRAASWIEGQRSPTDVDVGTVPARQVC